MENEDQRVLRFLEYVNTTCENSGVLIEMMDVTHFIVRNQKVYAYFEPPSLGPPLAVGTIYIAIGSSSPHPLHKLVHEFGHFTQWSEGAEVWLIRRYMYERYMEMAARKKKIPNNERAGVRRSIRALELDCEQRAVALIKTWDLPLDVSEYTQYANAHIWWHSLAVEHAASGIRHPFHTPPIDPSIVALCPKEFLDDYNDVPQFFRDACAKKP